MERFLTTLSLLLVTCFLVWTAAPDGVGSFVDRQDEGYNNLLVRGLLKGQLSLDREAPPELAEVEDPYDPQKRRGMGLHDASYYKGKYYIYFGITPILLLFLPFHWLTGQFMVDHGAVAIFAVGGFLVAWMLVRSIARTYFPRTPFWVMLACLWAVGLANMVAPMLRRAAMWEVPIACAYALFMVVLFCVWKALSGGRRAPWVVLASLMMGLCVGARPTYLLGSVVLLAPLAQMTGGGRMFWQRREWWRLAVLTVLPIAMVGAGLALYNFLRFDNPLEFGQTYQMAGDNVSKLTVLSASYIPFNLHVYLFSLPGFSPYFPFLTVIDPPSVPAGQFGIENPYGVIPGMPWVLLAGWALWRAVRGRDALAWWIRMTFAGVALVFGLVCCFGGNTNRYQVDFVPGLTLLAAVGALVLAETCRGIGFRRRVWAIGVVGLVLWSGVFNVFISLQHNGLLEANHPARYARIAHFFNHGSHWLAKIREHRDGPVELRLVFPQHLKDKVEPLVVTGHQFLSDYLFVHYLDQGLIRFGLDHTSRGTKIGPVTRIDPAAEHVVVVQMGSLYPPRAHPYFDALSHEESERRTREVKVLLDGRTVLQAMVDCYDASDWQPTIGTSKPNRPGFPRDFSGRIIGQRRLPPLESDFAENRTGKLHLLIRLPAFTVPRSEPLLSTGEAGKGDLIYIRYLDANHYQIAHDHWGYGGIEGPVIGYDPNVPLDLDISCPPLLGDDAPQRLVIHLNGSPLINTEARFHPSHSSQIAVGRNLIGASTAEEVFSGVIEIQERVTP